MANYTRLFTDPRSSDWLAVILESAVFLALVRDPLLDSKLSSVLLPRHYYYLYLFYD